MTTELRDRMRMVAPDLVDDNPIGALVALLNHEAAVTNHCLAEGFEDPFDEPYANPAEDFYLIKEGP